MSGALTKRVRANFVTGRLSQNIDDTVTDLTAVDFADLPEVVQANGEYAMVTIDPDETGGDPEIVRIYEHAAGSQTISVIRGAEGTTARAHSSTTEWRLASTVDDYEAIEQATSDVIDGLSTKHADLTDLAEQNDDHPQYLNQTRGDARYIQIGGVAWGDVTDKPSTFAPSSHAYSVHTGTVPIGDLPTGTSSSTVALGNHTHSAYAPTSHTHPWGNITGVPTASTSSQGIVQLSNTVGTSITRAATQALANTIWAKANEIDSTGGDVSSGTLRVTSNAIFQALGTGSRKTTINELLAGIVAINSGLSVNQVTASALWPYNNSLSTVRYPAATTGVIHQAYTSSSEQDKKYIQPVREEDAIFDRLNPVWFKYKADHPLRKFYSSEEEYQRFENPDSIGRMGFIAEEVREVAPHWVLEREDVGLGIAFEGMLPDFTAWAVARIQQLMARVTELEAQLV